MNVEPSTQAADTSARLQQAERSGLPVLIPGTLERHAESREAIEVLADPAAAYARSAEVFDRARRELEREGGGAPRNRTPSRYGRILATIRRWV